VSLFARVSPLSSRVTGEVGDRLSRVIGGRELGRPRRRGQAGQALPLFVLMIFVLTGSVAVVTDVSWFWVNQQKMQRAADAGALAGAVFLPGDPTSAYAAARAATARNGYTDGVGGVTITPLQETTNRRRLDVSVAGPIGTYFARVFGMNQIAGSAMSKAEFTLPVPMGSPQAWYGVGDFMKNTITTSNSYSDVDDDTGWDPEALSVSGGQWTNPNNAASNNDVYTT
jgi:Putative Flp pilus-assembly TadE/G-like